jgi:tricorn protease-like protein
MKGIGEIVAHNAILPAPVGNDSVAFLRIDDNIPGKPMELFVRDLKSGKEMRMLPGFNFKDMPSFTYAFEPNGKSFVVPRLISGEWELMQYQTGQRQGEVVSDFKKFRKNFPADLTRKLKTKSELLVTISDLAFAPSGKKVIFNLSLPDHSAIWTLDLATKRIMQVSPNNVGYYPHVCRDDNFVYFTDDAVRSSKNFDQDIVKRSIITGDIDTLVSDGANEFGGVLSPDEKYIAYAQRKNEITDIWVKNLKTKEKKKITSTPDGGHCNFPMWSANGKWIYYQVAGVEDIPMTARQKFTGF